MVLASRQLSTNSLTLAGASSPLHGYCAPQSLWNVALQELMHTQTHSLECAPMRQMQSALHVTDASHQPLYHPGLLLLLLLLWLKMMLWCADIACQTHGFADMACKMSTTHQHITYTTRSASHFESHQQGHTVTLSTSNHSMHKEPHSNIMLQQNPHHTVQYFTCHVGSGLSAARARCAQAITPCCSVALPSPASFPPELSAAAAAAAAAAQRSLHVSMSSTVPPHEHLMAV